MSKSLDRLTLLETFVRIVEAGSVSAAARDLGLSQPSASRQLAELEARFKSQLVVRTTHDLSLTPTGAELLTDVRQLLDQWEALQEKYLNTEGEVRGQLKIVAPVALGQQCLTESALGFQQHYPQVALSWQLQDGNIRFAEAGCDCWFKIGPVTDSTLVVDSLGTVERLAVATPKLLAAVPTSPRELETLPWISLVPFEGDRIPLSHPSGQSVTLSPAIRLATNNIFALKQAVLAGAGAAILPKWFIQNALQTGELIDILPEWRAPSLTVNVAYRRGRHQPLRLRRFIEWVTADISSLFDE